MCNNNNNTNNSSIISSRQSSPITNSTLSHAALKKRILNALKQEAQDEQHNNQMMSDSSPYMEQIIEQDKQQAIPNVNISTVDTAVKKGPSGFLITSPTSTITNSSASTSTSSTNTHFNYENLPSTIPTKLFDTNPTTNTSNTNNSSFQWPSQISQFRRQNLNIGGQTPNAVPSTPYTPPPMLSPFRKGPGLYYHVFSQTTPAAQQTSMVATPALPFTPIPDEISGPKMNIGEKYQAMIPKLRTKKDQDETGL